jgi:hypothetical protein
MTTDPIVFLVEVDTKAKVGGAVTRRYYATPPGYQARRTDADPDRAYLPLVEQAGDVELSITSYGETTGQTQVAIGETVLSNRVDWRTKARPLNTILTNEVHAGGRIAVYAGPASGSRDTDFPAVFAGRMELEDPTRGTVILTPRDRALDFDTPILSTTYAGTGGLEGTASMTGIRKERCVGHVLRLRPTYLGKISGRHVFSANGGNPIEGFVRVQDGGVDLTETAGVPTAGQWRQTKANGTFELGGNIAFEITCEVQGDKTGGTWRTTAGDLVRFMATTVSGLRTDPGDLDTASFTALNTAAPHKIGRWFPAGDETSYRQFFDEAVAAVRGYWLEGPDEKLSVGRVTPASGTPVRILARETDHRGAQPLSRSTGRETPVKQVTVRFAPNYAVSDEAALDRNVADDSRALLTRQWREEPTAVDTATAALYGTAARVLPAVETLLFERSAAATIGAELLADLKEVRRVYEVPCNRPFPDVKLLDVVQVFDDLPGFEAGKLLRIIGRRINQRASTYTFVGRE